MAIPSRASNGQFKSADSVGLWKKLTKDQAALHEFSTLVDNVMSSRKELFSRFFDPRRNIDDECGYPITSEITAERFRDMYDREAIAARVVEVFPKESWQSKPTVYEMEDVETVTAFEESWDNLGRQLYGTEPSYYQDEECSPIWEYLLRADVLSGIGHFGIILLGLDDGLDLNQPAEFKPSKSATRRLLYLRTFDESLVDITRIELDKNNPRFGQPLEYLITFSDPKESASSLVVTPTTTLPVHWTRVVHITDNLGSSEILGVPRQRPVWNRLMDLRKTYGGSAEMYWRGGFPGLSIETNPNVGGDVRVIGETKDHMEQYMNGLQRYLLLQGMTAKSLAPQVSDPSTHIDIQITAICIKLGIPKRVFMGSERGELASSQDDLTWNDRLRQRQSMHVTPRVIIPFVNRLINLGILPQPVGFSVVWPNLDQLSSKDKAELAVQRTEALSKYVAGSVESLIVPMDYLTRIMDFTEEEATEIVEAAVEALEEKEALMEQAKTELIDEQGLLETESTGEQANGPFQVTGNVFCPTGKGGVDPTCGKETTRVGGVSNELCN